MKKWRGGIGYQRRLLALVGADDFAHRSIRLDIFHFVVVHHA
jgi:hypothetical protein